MKFIAVVLLAASFSGAVMAGPIQSTKNVAINVGISVGGVIIAPSYGGIMSLAACAQAPNIDLCVGEFLSSYGVLSSSTAALLKEDIKNVEVDAYDYLAGADKTLALEEMIVKIRKNAEGSEKYSDAEIVSAMLRFI